MAKRKAAERISLTPNQLKVIRDKYLRDAPSVEGWLMGVARNVARPIPAGMPTNHQRNRQARLRANLAGSVADLSSAL